MYCMNVIEQMSKKKKNKPKKSGIPPPNLKKNIKLKVLVTILKNITQLPFLLQRQCGPLRRLPSRWLPSPSPTRRRIASGWPSARRCATPPSTGSCAGSSTGRIWRAWRPPVPAFRRIWWPRPSSRWEQEAGPVQHETGINKEDQAFCY